MISKLTHGFWRKLANIVAVYATFAGALPASVHAAETETTAPIRYLLVIFQENVSFDHYLATYPVP